MPFVNRNAEGKIVSQYQNPKLTDSGTLVENQEFVERTNADFLEFEEMVNKYKTPEQVAKELSTLLRAAAPEEMLQFSSTLSQVEMFIRYENYPAAVALVNEQSSSLPPGLKSIEDEILQILSSQIGD